MKTRVWVVAASLALLSLGGLVREQMPAAKDLMFAPFEYGAEAPTLGTAENLSVTVADTLNGKPSQAGWVLVDLDYTPAESARFLAGQIEAADGKLYGPANATAFACELLYPGHRTPCTFVFEMPAEQLGGATLRLGPTSEAMAPRIVLPLEEAKHERQIQREEVRL